MTFELLIVLRLLLIRTLTVLNFKLSFGFILAPAAAAAATATSNVANAANDESSENRSIQSAVHGTKADHQFINDARSAECPNAYAKYQRSEHCHSISKYWRTTAKCTANGSHAKSNSNTADSATATAKSTATESNAANWRRSNAICKFGTTWKCIEFQCNATAADESRSTATNQYSTSTAAIPAATTSADASKFGKKVIEFRCDCPVKIQK